MKFPPVIVAVACVLFATNVSGDGPLTVAPIVAAAEQARVAAVARAMPSAVSVFIPGGGGGGSGVLISPDGYALTNFHVSSPAGTYMRCGLSDGNVYDTVIVGIDPVGDLALIRLLGRDDFPFATIADSRQAQAGDWCMVIGNPFLLASNLQPTVTWGLLSGVGRYQEPSGTLLEYADCLQTDASINPGNSGGPIYNADGELLGIVGRASFEKRGRVNVGVGYAISINQAKNFLGHLHSGRILDHATLGATVVTDSDGGVTVSNILESSDAYRRGLRYAAEIISIDGRDVRTANDAQNIIATLPSGWRVKLVYRYDDLTIETLVRLRSVHGQDELLQKMAAALPPPPPRPDPPKSDEGDGETPKQVPPADHKSLVPSDDELPAEVANLFTARRGYANYFFNVLRQTKFIDALRDQYPKASQGQPVRWSILGTTDDKSPTPVKIDVGATVLRMQVGETVLESANVADLYDAVGNRSVAGILPALDRWRQMQASGPNKFGESFYMGQIPLGGERPLRDCMVGIQGELEICWLTHPDTGLVEVVEVIADRDADPAELWVWRGDENAESMPTALELKYGTDSILKIKINAWESIVETDETVDANDFPPNDQPENASETDDAADDPSGGDA